MAGTLDNPRSNLQSFPKQRETISLAFDKQLIFVATLDQHLVRATPLVPGSVQGRLLNHTNGVLSCLNDSSSVMDVHSNIITNVSPLVLCCLREIEATCFFSNRTARRKNTGKTHESVDGITTRFRTAELKPPSHMPSGFANVS